MALSKVLGKESRGKERGKESRGKERGKESRGKERGKEVEERKGKETKSSQVYEVIPHCKAETNRRQILGSEQGPGKGE